MSKNNAAEGGVKRTWKITVSLLSLLAIMLATVGVANAAGPVCQTTSPGGPSYSVRVCITVGSGGTATATGDTTVSSTVTITGTSPGIRKLIFRIDGEYLLTEYLSPFTFVLPTARFVDGLHTLSVEANLRDEQNASSPPLDVTFVNGTTTAPPIATGFQPAAGNPAGPGGSYVLAAVGDGASGEKASDDVVNLIDSWNPNMFLYLGDVYDKGTRTEFKNWYGEQGSRFGKFKSITNPVIGNHEYENGIAPGYNDYWATPPDYYSYDAGGWHFIALNSNSQFGQFTPGTPQYDWLQSDLAANPNGCSLAYFHHPVLSVGPQGSNPSLNQIWSLLVDAGVDIVLTGHEHHYQRWYALDRDLELDPNGVTQFIVGGGGHGVRATVRNDPRVAQVNDTTADGFGALKLDLSGGSALYSYINPNGTVRDTGTVTCSGTPDDVTDPSVPANVTATTGVGPNVTVGWTASSDDQGLASYEVRRDGAIVATVPASETTWLDATTEPHTDYVYNVRAVDLAGNTSAWSADVPVNTPGSQTEHIWTVSADSFVDATKATTNYGNRPDLRLDTSPEQLSFLRFVATGIGQQVPSSLVLKVRAVSSLTAGFEVRSVSGSWTESGLTYANKPAVGPVLATSGPVAADSWVEIPLAGFVNGDGTYDLALTPLSSTALKLDSRESGNAAELIADVADAETNASPFASNVSITTAEDTSATWTPEVFDADGDPLICSIDTQPGAGQATVASDCSGGTYTPNANANGSDSFGYSVTDGEASSTGTVSVTVNAVNDAPVAAAANATTWAGTSTQVALSAQDVDGDCPLTFEITSPPDQGSLGSVTGVQCSGGNATASVTYTADFGWTGTTTFNYVARDQAGLQTQAPGTVVVTSPPPVITLQAEADSFVEEDRPTANFGSRPDLRLDSSPVQEAYVRFVVTGLGTTPAADTVFRIRASSTLAAGFDVRLASGAWTESDLTWNNRPGYGAVLASSGAVSAGTWVSVTVPGLVTGDGTYDLVLTPKSTTNLKLDSRESATPPELVVTR